MTETETFVNFDVGATDDEVALVRRLFDDVGVAATVSNQPYSLVASIDVNVDPFVVVATAAASGFLTAFATKAGGDAYDKLKSLVTGLRAARQRDQGRIEIILRSEAGQPDIVIGPDTPAAALGALLTAELPPAPSGVIEYDPQTGRWTDAGNK